MSESPNQGFELFWEASTLTPATIGEFGARVLSYEPSWRPRTATYPGPDVALPVPGDRLMRTMRARRSSREFGPGKLPADRLAGLLAAFGRAPGGRPVYPSAGGLYPLEVYCLANAVAGELNGRILVYNPDLHSVSPVAECPAWERYRDLLGSPLEGIPQVVFVFVLDLESMLAKYGERGGRFALIEVGHAAHSLALRIAHENLVGCELGGLLDGEVAELLGLPKSLRVALGYACGLPPGDRDPKARAGR